REEDRMASWQGIHYRARRAVQETRRFSYFNYYLKNGTRAYLADRRKAPVPPLRFRNGITWHHGRWDQPALLFSEIFLDRFYEPVKPPQGVHIIDIGANIGALTTLWSAGRPDLHLWAYEPNPDSYATLRRNVEANHLSAHTYAEAVGREAGELALWVDVPTT